MTLLSEFLSNYDYSTKIDDLLYQAKIAANVFIKIAALQCLTHCGHFSGNVNICTVKMQVN